MNIYIFDESSSSSKNGIGTFITTLIDCLNDTIFNINVLSFNSKDDELKLCYNAGITTFRFPMFDKGNFIDNSLIITKLMNVYINDDFGNIFFFNHSPCANLLSSIKKYYPLSKIVFIIHDLCWTSHYLGNIYELVLNNTKESCFAQYIDDEKNTFDLADKVVCLSEDTRNVMINIYEIPIDKIVLIHNGLPEVNIIKDIIKKEKIRSEFNIHDTDMLILYVGRGTRSKGFISLLSAFKQLVEIYNRVRLIVAGSIYVEKELPSSVSTKITYLGHVSKEDLYKWYTITDIGVIPSYSEQCSYVGIEMLAHGVAIVASDGFGMIDMFNSNNSRVAKIVERNNEDIFANNILNELITLISNDKLRDKLSIKARDSFLERYTIAKMKKSYIDCIASL